MNKKNQSNQRVWFFEIICIQTEKMVDPITDSLTHWLTHTHHSFLLKIYFSIFFLIFYIGFTFSLYVVFRYTNYINLLSELIFCHNILLIKVMCRKYRIYDHKSWKEVKNIIISNMLKFWIAIIKSSCLPQWSIKF